MRYTITIDGSQIHGDLADFPVRVAVQDDALRSQAAVHCCLPDGTPLAAEIARYDPVTGALEAWVRVPRLRAGQDVRLGVAAGEGPSGAWDDGYRLVRHQPPGVIPHDVRLDLAGPLTVEAWYDVPEAPAEAFHALVGKWQAREDFGEFAVYDASCTEGLDTTGFFGAVFDGRYVYFAPQHDTVSRHGKVLRYDTHGGFHDPASWAAYDASGTSGLRCQGYYGAAFDGRYVIFPPRRDPEGFHARALRYDTRGDFHDPASWTAYDAGMDNSCQSVAFDGRYLYLNPGQRAERRTTGAADDDSPRVTGFRADQVLVASGNVTRYDTQGRFDDPASWMHFDLGALDRKLRDFDGSCFDGRYVYLAPLAYAVAARYDTRAEFIDSASWQRYDCGARFGMKRTVGVIFDGRHVYYVPYGECPVAVRFDTAGDFADDAAWEAIALARIPGMILGFDGACFDGRFVYYIPYYDEGTVAHGVVLRYDTRGAFTDPASWAVHDATCTEGQFTGGFNGGACDGRYLYFAPWLRDASFSGKIGGGGHALRYDTTGDGAAFDLRLCDLGHNGGLCAALPGPRFLVNTEHGPRSVAANAAPPAGRHHLAGVYDGEWISLYLDGRLVNRRPAAGALVRNAVDVTIGTGVYEVRISAVARSAAWLATSAALERVGQAT